MVEEFIPIFGILFGIGGPMVVIIVWFALNYHKRRKLMELHGGEISVRSAPQQGTEVTLHFPPHCVAPAPQT